MAALEVIASIVGALALLAWRVEVIVSMLKRDRNETLPDQAEGHDRNRA